MVQPCMITPITRNAIPAGQFSESHARFRERLSLTGVEVDDARSDTGIHSTTTSIPRQIIKEILR